MVQMKIAIQKQELNDFWAFNLSMIRMQIISMSLESYSRICLSLQGLWLPTWSLDRFERGHIPEVKKLNLFSHRQRHFWLLIQRLINTTTTAKWIRAYFCCRCVFWPLQELRLLRYCRCRISCFSCFWLRFTHSTWISSHFHRFTSWDSLYQSTQLFIWCSFIFINFK